jgi:hypothetical protein
LPRVAFGPWTPDRHPLAVGDSGLLRAENAVPYGGQYRGFPGWAAITASGAIVTTARVRGSIAGVGSGGVPYHFSGDDAKLYELQSTGIVDVSDSAVGPPSYALAAQDIWQFTQFGNVIIAAGGVGQKLQAFVMGTSTMFKPIDSATFGGTGTAPTARWAWVVGRQVFAGNLVSDPNGIHRSAIDNPHGWPTPGSGTAVATFSGTLSLPGGGTKINAMRGFGEVGGILKDESLWRADFVGGEVAWEFRQVVEGVGLLIPNLAIPWQGTVLFYSAHGWKLWAYGSEVVPVGDGIVDRWFRENYDPNYPERFSFAVDEDENFCLINFTGTGNVGGAPNRTMLFHFPTRQFATLEGIGIEHITNAFQPTSALSIDAMAQTPIDQLSGSPDDPTSPKKVHVAGYENTSHELGLFSGALLEMLLETGDITFAPEQRSMVSCVRPMVDTDSLHAARVAVGVRSKRSEDPVFGTEQQQANDGETYHRADGRYHRFRTRIPSGATDVQAMGLEVDIEADGSGR